MPVSKRSKASLGQCTHSVSAAEFTVSHQAADAVREWERLDLLQDGFAYRIAVCGEVQAAFESICYDDHLFAKSLGRMLSYSGFHLDVRCLGMRSASPPRKSLG
jgi:hypothetical protein